MSPRGQVQERDQKHWRSLIFSTSIANEPSEPGSKATPKISTKLDLLDRHRKWALGARFQKTRPESSPTDILRFWRRNRRTGARGHDQKQGQQHPRWKPILFFGASFGQDRHRAIWKKMQASNIEITQQDQRVRLTLDQGQRRTRRAILYADAYNASSSIYIYIEREITK